MQAVWHIMIVLVYVTLSALGAAFVHLRLGYDPVLSGLLGLGVALAIGQVHAAFARLGAAAEMEKRLGDIKSEVRKMGARVTRTEERALDLEQTIDKEITGRRETLVNEMRGLEDMISRLGRKFESRLQVARSQTPDPSIEGNTALDAVRDALRENRVDLHLQPIVNLPQRRVCFYEGYTRLRRADNTLIMPGEFLAAAEKANLLGVIDNMLLFRCVQIVRRLSERDRRVGVFCNIGMSSLEDEQFFATFLEFMKENRDLAGSLIFELGVRTFKSRSEIASRNMGRLRDLGFRFSLDKGDGLVFDLPDLQSAGVRFVKVNGDRLLEELTPGGERPQSAIVKEIAPEDVPAVFNRYGVDLIAEKVESEKSVIELLEFDIPYGQGHVFGAPRPIKGSLLEETTPPPEFTRRVVAPPSI
jgi:cyclic-di-GMP phosphodiesterase, flagellum assembly factor TipF